MRRLCRCLLELVTSMKVAASCAQAYEKYAGMQRSVFDHEKLTEAWVPLHRWIKSAEDAIPGVAEVIQPFIKDPGHEWTSGMKADLNSLKSAYVVHGVFLPTRLREQYVAVMQRMAQRHSTMVSADFSAFTNKYRKRWPELVAVALHRLDEMFDAVADWQMEFDAQHLRPASRRTAEDGVKIGRVRAAIRPATKDVLRIADQLVPHIGRIVEGPPEKWLTQLRLDVSGLQGFVDSAPDLSQPKQREELDTRLHGIAQRYRVLYHGVFDASSSGSMGTALVDLGDAAPVAPSAPSVPPPAKEVSGFWQDEFWLTVQRVLDALQDDPQILDSKEPDWESGLNINAINHQAKQLKLTDQPIIEHRTVDEGWPHPTRWLDFRSADRPDIIHLRIWDHALGHEIPTQYKFRRIVEHVRSWQSARERQVTAAAGPLSPSTTDDARLLEIKPLVETFSDTDGTWVKNVVAAKMEGLEPSTLGDYRVRGIRNADKLWGIDRYHRIWFHPGTIHSHPWYLKQSLKSERS